MKRVILVVLLFTLITANVFDFSYNTREEYLFGVGATIGGPLGILGMQADMHVYNQVGVALGVGSGIYFNSFNLQFKYYLFSDKFSPFVALGYASWENIGAEDKLAKVFDQAINLGLVTKDGKRARNSIHLLPLTFGASYLSEVGLSVSAEFDYLISLDTTTGEPYGGLVFQWYF